jgi:xanthine dehydrogenase/oxidase
MPRAQNAHAHVNAAFLLKFNADKTVIEEARIVYGAISPEFNRAIATEKFLIGKNIFSNGTLKLAIETLSDEIFPDTSPPEPTPLYRKRLAVGLFYKVICNYYISIQIVMKIIPQSSLYFI